MMADNFIGGIQLKRKDFHHFSHDFLSSPPLKIRRLDVELPPISEEEDGHHQLVWEISGQTIDGLKLSDIEDFPFVLENEEKAIVVFRYVDPLVYSSGKYLVNPNLISSFKSQVLRGSNLNPFPPTEEDEPVTTGDNSECNTCKAVIPWVPSHQLNQRCSADAAPQAELSDGMDAQGLESSAMEVDDAGDSSFWQQRTENMNDLRLNEVPHQQQWQLQHCMIPPPLHNVATPVVWYR